MWGALSDEKFLLDIASAAFLRSESHGTHEHIETPPIWRAKFLYFPQEQGSPVIPPGIGYSNELS
jgi:hypothetical protein